ncbi:hypothetical protein Scep_004450 [Stephania cephalantha]|uniref:Uncharacterized protein n=1 Tax=Stephania cephalantha TaxID=152367 RepID=A0AAP0KSN2_9MAGN
MERDTEEEEEGGDYKSFLGGAVHTRVETEKRRVRELTEQERGFQAAAMAAVRGGISVAVVRGGKQCQRKQRRRDLRHGQRGGGAEAMQRIPRQRSGRRR